MGFQRNQAPSDACYVTNSNQHLPALVRTLVHNWNRWARSAAAATSQARAVEPLRILIDLRQAWHYSCAH